MLMRSSFSSIIFCKKLHGSDVLKIHLGASHFSSQQVPAVQRTEDSQHKQLKDFQTITNITNKVRVKKPQKPPFIKNLLLGKFDTDILTYPELDKEDTNNLEKNVKMVKNLMKQNHMARYSSLSKEFRQNLSDFKAIGLQAPHLMDGRACNITENCTFLESLSESHLRNSIVHNEQLGAQVLNKYGDEQLKIKYLTKLMSGELLSAMCISELDSLDLRDYKTQAKQSADGKTWILNGVKHFVVNGKSADFLIVLAVTKVTKRDIIKETEFTAFLVDKDSPGISVESVESKGIEIVNVTFNETPIPCENILGEVHKGHSFLTSLITDLRLSVGPMCIAVSKNILNNLITEIRLKADEKNLLYETDSVREMVAKMAMALYAMESTVYLTTGLADNYTDQDIEVESIVTKVFSSEQTLNCATDVLNMIGLSAVSDSHWLHPFYQEAIRFKTLNEPDDGLKIILALLCLQHAGKSLNDFISKIRNPLFHAGFNFRRMWINRRNNEDNPKLDLQLGEYLHPSLLNASQQLEYCVKRIEFAAEIMLARYGPQVFNYHMDLRRMADSIIDTFVMTACLGRSSRAYCIGLPNADLEMMIASSFVILQWRE